MLSIYQQTQGFPGCVFFRIPTRCAASQLGDVLDIIGGPYSTRNTLFGNSGTVETADTEIMISLHPGDHAPSADYISDLRAQLPIAFP